MKVSLFLAAAMSAVSTLATQLFVSDYSGSVTTLKLTASNGTYSLNETSVSKDCAPNPSWLTIDPNRGLLFCLNEGLTTQNGSLSSFTINQDGSLNHVQNSTTISGPVSGVIYGHPAGQRAIALAHYSGSAVSSWLLQGRGKFTNNQDLLYTLDHPGPVPDRQAAPHEHEAIIDPTGQYVLVPDLGADLVRVFSWDSKTLKLTAKDPLQAAPGSGPRHAAFWNPSGVSCDGCTTYFYVVAELASTVTGYAVEYLPNGGGLSFREVYKCSTYGNQLKTPEGNAPAEIHVSPDNRFLVISNRNDSSFTITLPDGTQGKSDSISTFQLIKDGTLSFVQLAPAGGSFPRHFSLNAIGNLVAVGLQNNNTVALFERNTSTGLIGEEVGRVPLSGNVTCVVWNEERALGSLGG